MNIPKIKPSEYIFLIDRSGSMCGKSIELAVEALKLFVHSLPWGSKFNIVSYGTEYDCMFSKSIKYDEKSMTRAAANLEEFKADYGGTEIYEPLQFLLN
mmetsp:Transcript_28937/g.27868  ORF Transcript_28937/g.27868 Transcript_28937/m.27868 type:complete len:99 (+) Transcript_28937:390-686(+)|eukprot:CAMPEP_0170550460 /NCGR_PEP_ID=MMETSP0211-20121228/8519_1 /TAXON_ID=311385 /ORGANISM="Pseudokeronopsis sp., Strain OXSARD2" /LENGTH=98 /DNA_ID=CAMNT_0010857029 /DNA_START=1098 /DNA_END=1394 /DNA_ORIENTATION=+